MFLFRTTIGGCSMALLGLSALATPAFAQPLATTFVKLDTGLTLQDVV